MSASQKASEIFTARTRAVISNILTQFQKKRSSGASQVMATEAQLQKTKMIKAGMMQELLTGKTRLLKPT